MMDILYYYKGIRYAALPQGLFLVTDTLSQILPHIIPPNSNRED